MWYVRSCEHIMFGMFINWLINDAHIFWLTVQVVYGGTSQARTVIVQHEFYLSRGRMNGVRGETNRIKFDVILTSYEILDVDTAVLKPINWKCTVLLSYYNGTIRFMSFFKYHMFRIVIFPWLDC